MSSASPRSRLRVVIALVVVVACKKAAPTAAPADSAEMRDDIAEIEAELARNAGDLQAAGIVVAQRAEPPPSASEPEPVDEEAPDEAGGEEAETPETSAPTAEPPEPAAAPPDDSMERESARGSRIAYRRRWLERRRDKKDASARCQRICDLAEATCELADRICNLATRHPDEVRYENVCESAEAHCEAAADACTACAE